MIIAATLAILLLTSCSNSPKVVKVSVLDGGQPIDVEGTDDMTVGELLGKAGITLGERDTVIPDKNTKLSDVNGLSILVRRYAKVSVIDNDTGKSTEVEMVGGSVKQAIVQAGYDLLKYSTQSGLEDYLTDGMIIQVSQSGQFAPASTDSVPQKASDSDSFVTGNDGITYYVGDNGEIDYGYCDGVTVDGEDWVITEGKATKVETDADATWFAAAKAIAQCTDSSMSREEKLKAAFDYIKTNYLEGVRHDPPYQEPDWPVVCANDIFVYGKGDCFSYGAAFAFMGKAIGYEDVYACNSGGHGWAEIEGKYYDPEWDMHNNEYNHFGVAPGDDCDVLYAESLMDGVDWMRMKV